MASKTQSKSSGTGWGGSGAGALVGAAVAGAAVGIAANMGRKLFVQFTSGATGDWLEALKAEHELTRAIFDRIEATDDSQTMTRTHLVAKLKHALDKHAAEEENVVYPALREDEKRQQADHLNADHGYVKTYLYELETTANDDPAWIARVRDFRAMIEKHMREEEEDIFPAFRSRMSDQENKELTALVNKEGYKHA